MVGLCTVVLVMLAGVDTLGPATVGAMSLKAPTQWATSEDEDGTKTWTSADQRAAASFYSGALDTRRTAKACVDALVGAVGGDGFESASVGGHPAAKKVTSDFVGEKDSDKTEANRIITTTWLGCDGKTKWLLTFSARKSDGARFGPVLKRVVESIRYLGTGAKK